jgi:hypothetical protein
LASASAAAMAPSSSANTPGAGTASREREQLLMTTQADSQRGLTRPVVGLRRPGGLAGSCGGEWIHQYSNAAVMSAKSHPKGSPDRILKVLLVLPPVEQSDQPSPHTPGAVARLFGPHQLTCGAGTLPNRNTRPLLSGTCAQQWRVLICQFASKHNAGHTTFK